ncbi:MAG: HAMP domain-containing histidine kinase [Treponema sp.]|nr:HAMP domain-containing histidine kinase [Treponema sp.]
MFKRKYTSKEYMSFATAYCIRVMTVMSLIFILAGGTAAVIVHFCFDGNYNMVFWTVIILILLICLQLIAPTMLVNILVKPLLKINDESKKLASGNFDIDMAYDGKVYEVKSIFENFNLMAKELSGMEMLHSDFISNVSHELKTPMAAIEGYAMLLQNPDISGQERQDCLDRILFSISRLNSLSNDILMLNRLENGTLKPAMGTCRLDEEIRQIILLCEPGWDEKNLEFDLHLEEISYTGPCKLLEHVWLNLINNSIKFSHSGGVIHISLAQEDGKIIFTIRDHGIGISEQGLKHIFDKFYQEDTQHKDQGNGLGLAQVKKILEITGNGIFAESEYGSGSVFTVELQNQA